jgi:single-stranded-DNA-specific exonuclease
VLGRFGGHRAAAGLSIDPDRLEQFAEQLAAHAASVLGDEDLRPSLRVDAVVAGRELTLDLHAELERLAPFGLSNPGVILLAAACSLSEVGVVGDGKHLKLVVTAGGARSGAIAFGQGGQADRFQRSMLYDVAFRLDANRWNGSVSPQLVVKRVFDTPEGYEALRDRLAAEWRAGEDSRSPEARAIFEELGLLDEPTRRRQLVESETFRSFLAGVPAAELRRAA